jgi:hypothetical protein
MLPVLSLMLPRFSATASGGPRAGLERMRARADGEFANCGLTGFICRRTIALDFKNGRFN